jgi:hypothetical protein
MFKRHAHLRSHGKEGSKIHMIQPYNGWGGCDYENTLNIRQILLEFACSDEPSELRGEY